MKKLALKKGHTSRRHKETAEEREQREYEEFLRLREKFESDEYEDEEDEYQAEEYEEDEYQDEEDDEESEELDEEELDEEEPEEELSEEEIAMFEVAEAYYEEGCDGNCDNCEYYEYCPAEEEVDPDSVEVIAGMTKGDIKATAQSGMYLAREGAMAAKELKEAMDDIMGVFDVKTWLK